MYRIHFIYHPQDKTSYQLGYQSIIVKYGVKDQQLGTLTCTSHRHKWKAKLAIDLSIFSTQIQTFWIQFHNQTTNLDLVERLQIPFSMIDRQSLSFDWNIKLSNEVQLVRCQDPYCMQYNIHAPQYQTSLDIVKHISTGRRHLILVAQMQSGKTGCAKSVAYNLINHCQYQANSIYFICGMNDNNLQEQTKKEFLGLIPEDNIYFSKTIQKIMTSSFESQSELGDRFRIGKSLLIIDESHYASNVDSMTYQFLKKIVGVTADGQTHNWTNKDVTILSVSATPMGELANLNVTSDKETVILQTGKDYYGLIDMAEDGLLCQAYNLNQEAQRSLFLNLMMKVYQEQVQQQNFKYCVVRLGSTVTRAKLEHSLNGMLSGQLSYINYHSGQGGTLIDFNTVVGCKPAQMTIIWIYDSLRAGKQLQTEHLYLVHDTHSCAPDVSAQGLAGRLCGYGKANYKVKCYTNLPSIMKYIDWLKHNYCQGRIPAGAKDIVNGYDATSDSHWQCHVPLAFTLTPDLIAYCLKHRQEHGKNTYTDSFKTYCKAEILNSTQDQPLIAQILNQYYPSKNGGFMILDTLNRPNSITKNWSQNYLAAREGHAIHGFVTPNTEPDHCLLFYVFLNLVPNHKEYGWGVICYKEYVKDLSLKRAEVKTTETNLYHNINWKPRIKLRLKPRTDVKEDQIEHQTTVSENKVDIAPRRIKIRLSS